MIFGTWMSYFTSWEILENKVRSPVGKKVDWVEGTFTFYFLSTTIHNNSSQNCIVSLTYPVYRLDWAFSVLQYCSIISFLFWKGLRMWPLFCPATSLRLWSILRGGRGSNGSKVVKTYLQPPRPSVPLPLPPTLGWGVGWLIGGPIGAGCDGWMVIIGLLRAPLLLLRSSKKKTYYKFSSIYWWGFCKDVYQ